jgi:UTP---glucose-1-phosphate uridylyltransferase
VVSSAARFERDLIKVFKLETHSCIESLSPVGLPVGLSEKRAYLFTALHSLGQEHLFPLSEKDWERLEKIEEFYAAIGGVIGYHKTFLSLLNDRRPSLLLEHPPWFDLRQNGEERNKAVVKGVEHLPYLGEIYVLGGLATRLNFCDEEGSSLPAALLPFKGKTLLEHLIRDVIGREALYEKVFGKRVCVPIAMMASDVHHHYPKIQQLCEKLASRYQRPLESFHLFTQIGVPVLDEEGTWQKNPEGELVLQPGGHGALWPTALQTGVFDWFEKKGVSSLLIRQINNPVAGIDAGLSALVGRSVQKKAQFGFASCPRPVAAEEGMLALVERNQKVTLSNIEYTDFKKYGLEDLSGLDGNSLFPANTNILFADLQSLKKRVKATPFAGMTVNLKQARKEHRVGRLESMMQSVSDLYDHSDVLMTYNYRYYTLSSSKKAYRPGGKVLGTPEKAYYDSAQTAHDLLTKTGWTLPPFPCIQSYIEGGLPYYFDYNPALGPLFSVMQSKLQAGKISPNSLLEIEALEVLMKGLCLKGTLLIKSLSLEGVCHLENVQIINQGMEVAAPFWKQKWQHQERVTIILHGKSALFARNITVEGNQTIEVPEGELWEITESGIEKSSLPDGYALWDYTFSEKEGVQAKERTYHSVASLQR